MSTLTRFFGCLPRNNPQITPLLLITVFLLTASCSGMKEMRKDTARSHLKEPLSRTIVTDEDYRRSRALMHWNLESKVWRSDIRPEWIDDNRFWYRVRTEEGFRFYRVDPDAAERHPAFDHSLVAKALAAAMEKDVSPHSLPFKTFRYVAEEEAIRFEADDNTWKCGPKAVMEAAGKESATGEPSGESHQNGYRCVEIAAIPRPDDSVLSPDERWAAFIHEYNLWVRDMQTGEEFALTFDGEPGYGYAANSQGWYRSPRPVLNWSPDSRKIAAYRLDEREVGTIHLLETAPGRPILKSWPYALPGDTIVPMHRRLIIDVEKQEKVWLDIEPTHQRTSSCCGLERDGQWTDMVWSDDSSKLAFLATSRDYKEVNLYLADTKTGAVRHIYKETADPFFESNLKSRGIPNWRILFNHNSFIWFSHRDDWGHLYLYSLDNGKKKRRITSGEWNVADLLHVDEASGRIYFTAVGKEPGRDPYQEYLYSVSFMDEGDRDQAGLHHPESSAGVSRPASAPQLMSPEEAHHDITPSPSGRFFVDEYATVQNPSVTVVRANCGREVMKIEEADIRALKEISWVKPEPFVVKARDGVADLYGLMYKPSFFDPERSWPVVVNIYPGPQAGSVGCRGFRAERRGQPHALAELGFVVIQLDALGTPMRSKPFHVAWYGDMSDNGIEDHVAAIRQLGARYSWLDTDRAGIYGHSGGGYATMSALLRYPGVFKAGVASAGNMDNRGYTDYWGEKYQGPRKIDEEGYDSYASQAIWKKAKYLEDALLITYGTTDSNVHPNTTLLLIDELIKENKDFELIVMPNRGHGYANEPYHLRRTWDFFVRHLLDATPPQEFNMAGP